MEVKVGIIFKETAEWLFQTRSLQTPILLSKCTYPLTAALIKMRLLCAERGIPKEPVLIPGLDP